MKKPVSMQPPYVGHAMLDEARVGTAMLTLQLRAAVQEAVQAEATLGNRDSARDELRGRLAVLVDRRQSDMAAELAAERHAAERLVEAARQQAAVIAEASALIASANSALVEAVVPPDTATPVLNGRARGAMLALQLRTAMQEANACEASESRQREASESRQREASESRQRQASAVEQLRRELEDGLTRARADAATLVDAARVEAAALIAAAEGDIVETAAVPAFTWSDVAWSHVEVADVVEPVQVEAVDVADIEVEDVEAAEIVGPVVAASGSAAPPDQTPVNVVIDAEAFARVFATVFATMFDERVAGRGAHLQPAPYPTQMYSVGQFALPQPASAPVKQSFWSHAKHVDVLLLSAAMVIVLVVLAAWLV